MWKADILNTIENYFDIKYKSIGELRVTEDIKECFLSNNERCQENYVCEIIALEAHINQRKSLKHDFRFSKYNYYLDYISLNINGNKAIVVLDESHDIYFNFLSNTKSQMRNLRHKIHLGKVKDKWYIIKDIYNDYYKKLIINYSKRYSYLDKIKEIILKQNYNNYPESKNLSSISYRSEIALAQNKVSKEKLYNYNRTNAVNYARMWALKLNPKWGNYESKGYGGDCTNFTSQCIYAGGIPFDFYGTSDYVKWYWYSNNKRVAPWTGAKQFNYYVQYNKGYGLKAHFGRLEDMIPGDIVQLGGNYPQTYHSMIISDYVYNSNGYVQDYLICQHSTSVGGRLKDYPLSSKPPVQKVYISIDGYYK